MKYQVCPCHVRCWCFSESFPVFSIDARITFFTSQDLPVMWEARGSMCDASLSITWNTAMRQWFWSQKLPSFTSTYNNGLFFNVRAKLLKVMTILSCSSSWWGTGSQMCHTRLVMDFSLKCSLAVASVLHLYYYYLQYGLHGFSQRILLISRLLCLFSGKFLFITEKIPFNIPIIY